MPQAKRWCFTLNNYNDDDLHVLRQSGDRLELGGTPLLYLVFGLEVAGTGTPHLQGFFLLQQRLRLQQLARISPFQRAHLEVTRGTNDQASTYCKKEGRYEEFGVCPSASQGKRTEFERLRDWLKEQDEVPSLRDVGEVFPSLLGRYPQNVKLFISLFAPKPTLVVGELREWQRRLDEVLGGEPDDRKIIFCIDPEGNAGKSWLTRYWYSNRDDLQMLSVGRRDDLAYAIDETKSLFVFDVPRGGMEFFQYGVLEMIKNRMVFSPKYQSVTKILTKPSHVVVFCNEDPDMEAMTRDRYKIIRINQL